jgi:hypothetical protein
LSGVPTFAAAKGSWNVMAHATFVGLPKQQPAKKHPKRPIT